MSGCRWGSLVSESRIHNGSTLALLGAVVLTPFDPLSNVFPPWIYSFYSFAAAAIKLGFYYGCSSSYIFNFPLGFYIYMRKVAISVFARH